MFHDRVGQGEMHIYTAVCISPLEHRRVDDVELEALPPKRLPGCSSLALAPLGKRDICVVPWYAAVVTCPKRNERTRSIGVEV